jgi:chitinase
VTGLLPSTTYSYYVKAKDAAGNISANSNSLNVTTAAADIIPPAAPTNLFSSIIAQTSFTLNWTASTDNTGVTGYNVYKDDVKVNASLITTTTYNVTGLSPATVCTMTVKAKGRRW